MILHAADLRGRPARAPAGCLVLFVVDASGSMAAWKRMRQTKAAVQAILHRAHQRRDRAALLAFGGESAELILPPTRELKVLRQAVEDLPVGGATPLAHALAAARALVRRQQVRQPRQSIWIVLLTDGRTNRAVTAADPWHDAVDQARALAASGADCVVVDTEVGWPRFGRAAHLARVLGAPCWSLEEVLQQARAG
jgi:magnesium chelatase subunit D